MENGGANIPERYEFIDIARIGRRKWSLAHSGEEVKYYQTFKSCEQHKDDLAAKIPPGTTLIVQYLNWGVPNEIEVINSA